MRLSLFIPVLMLFLSNVPFVQQIPMEQAMAMIEENGNCGQQEQCGRRTENVEATCSMEEPDCKQRCTNEETMADPGDDNCCQQTGTTCVCVLCFQYAAPVHSITEYVFDCSFLPAKADAFLISHIKDPHIGAPWQPPDVV